MITPLDVKIVVLAECVQDDMGSGSSVINIPHNVQQVDGQPLDQIAEGNDEIVGTPRCNDGVDNLIDVGRLVRLNR